MSRDYVVILVLSFGAVYLGAHYRSKERLGQITPRFFRVLFNYKMLTI
jgi:hypothetical protein